jgi:hypothetical protein
MTLVIRSQEEGDRVGELEVTLAKPGLKREDGLFVPSFGQGVHINRINEEPAYYFIPKGIYEQGIGAVIASDNFQKIITKYRD